MALPLLPTFIDSNMVLQRAPQQASVWGHNVAPGETVSLQLNAGSYWSTTADSGGNSVTDKNIVAYVHDTELLYKYNRTDIYYTNI